MRHIVPTISITAVSSLLQYDNQQAFLIPNVFLEMTVPWIRLCHQQSTADVWNDIYWSSLHLFRLKSKMWGLASCATKSNVQKSDRGLVKVILFYYYSYSINCGFVLSMSNCHAYILQYIDIVNYICHIITLQLPSDKEGGSKHKNRICSRSFMCLFILMLENPMYA